MSAPILISGLAEIADRYDAVLCDVWGVVHNGRERFSDACTALEAFQQVRGPVVLISNAPRPAEDVKPQLRTLGVPEAAWSGFVTSGDATRVELQRRSPGPAWAVGPARDAALYAGLGLELVERPQDARFISCTGLFDDEVETPDDFRGRLEACAERKLEMVCANPDRVVQRGDRLIYCAGALADLYASMGGPVVMAGKPFAPIYVYAYDVITAQAGRRIDPQRILAIGDGLPTDVRGANGQGLDLLFVAAGIHAADTLGAGGQVDAQRVQRFFDSEGAEARYVMAELAW